MKVVLFAGGLGLRMQEAAPSIPKPMVPIANRPILLHIMKYYAHFGHDDFIICLGHKGEVIKEFFLNYNEALANDFVLSGWTQVELSGSDIGEWRDHIREHGPHSNASANASGPCESISRAKRCSLAPTGIAATDAPLQELIANFREREQDGRVPACGRRATRSTRSRCL